MTAVYSVYASLNDTYGRLGLTIGDDTTRDAMFKDLLQSASRWIDYACARHIGPRLATKYLTAESGACVKVPDLLSVTTLKTDDSADRSYTTTWATTDYDLFPYNYPPYQRLDITPDGLYSFPARLAKGVQVVGMWGFVNDTLAGTTLNEALDASETGVDVASGSAAETMHTARVDSEDMLITSISSNTWTVTRNVNDTTAATHDNAATVTILDFPYPVKEVCILKTIQLWKKKDMVGDAGATATPGLGQARIPSDKYIMELLAPFVKVR